LSWAELVNGEAALAVALHASLGAFAAQQENPSSDKKATAKPQTAKPPNAKPPNVKRPAAKNPPAKPIQLKHATRKR
jgi:hypothetical protein